MYQEKVRLLKSISQNTNFKKSEEPQIAKNKNLAESNVSKLVICKMICAMQYIE